jgi:hypothetical protein
VLGPTKLGEFGEFSPERKTLLSNESLKGLFH